MKFKTIFATIVFGIIFLMAGCATKGDSNIYLKNTQLGGTIEYALNGDGNGYIVHKYEGNDAYIAIPNKHEGLPVVGVDKNAFRGISSLETIIFPDSIKTIAYGAVYECRSIKNVVFGSDTTYSPTAIRECYPNRVYYKGTEEDWKSKKYGDEFYLQRASIFFYSKTKVKGMWHYNANGRIEVWS